MNKNFKRKSIFLAVLLAVSTCAAAKGKIPQWYVQPEKDTLETLYGTGVGLSVNAAKNHALRDIVEKISLSVKSETSSSRTLSAGTLSSSYQDNVQLDSEKITLTGNSIEKSAKAGFNYYVLASVPRQNIIDGLTVKADKAASNLTEALRLYKERSLLDNFIQFNKINKDTQELSRINLLLASVNDFHDPATNKALVSEVLKKQSEIKNTITIAIEANSTLLPVKQKMQSLFYDRGILSKSGKPDLVIKLSSTKSTDEVFGTLVANVQLNLTLKNKKNHKIFSEALTESGSSVSSFKSAEKIAITNLANKVSEYSYLNVLGIK